MFEWEQYFLFAEKIINVEFISDHMDLEEACLRSAISRFYYAVFCISRNYIRDFLKKTIPNKDSHKFVREEFINSSEKNKQKIGEYLKQLSKKRKDADYEDNIKIDRNAVLYCMNQANEALKLLKNINK
jgi:uncharacterized protein (UPF0332 family)